jgi:tripartite-type tricarboxylate transporter receptor subunit TctC
MTGHRGTFGISRRALLTSGTAALVTTAAVPVTAAQPFPDRLLRWIVPRAAGGSIDAAGRIVAEAMATELGQPIVIDARPGANGTIGAALVARAPADGYTWLLPTINHLVAPLLQPAQYHPVNDFAAAARLGGFSTVAVVPADLPVTSMTEFIALARQRPGQMNYLNTGNGSSMHLNTELLKLRQGIDLVSVQYKGMAPAIADLLNGHLQFGFTTPSLVLQHIQAGRLRALAVGDPVRHPALPSVPTLAELGLADVQLESWFVLTAPAGTPPAILDRLNASANRVLQNPDLRRRLESASLTVLPPLSPAGVQAMLARDHDRYRRLIEQAGIKADP